VVGFDNKLSPAESVTAMQAAIDQGVRYLAQGNGSSVAGALIDAVNRHNTRNPGKEVIFLNYAAVDPTSPTASAATGTSASTPTRR
jgi:branched-chain amino acid transport system substrate-binding protein